MSQSEEKLLALKVLLTGKMNDYIEMWKEQEDPRGDIYGRSGGNIDDAYDAGYNDGLEHGTYDAFRQILKEIDE